MLRNLFQTMIDDPPRTAFSSLAALCIVVLIIFLVRDDLDGVGAATILGLAGVFVFLAAGGKSLIGRISKVGPGGIELAWDAARRLAAIPSSLKSDVGGEGYGLITLSEEQKWDFHIGTDLIMYCQHQGTNVRELPVQELKEYRKLIVVVGRLAFVEGEFGFRKALYLIRPLEEIPDRTAEESFILGEAYRMAYDKDPTELQSARMHLEEAARKDPDLAKARFCLAWVYDELHQYARAVAENDKAAELDPMLLPAAYRNAACALVKLNKADEALDKLDEIPAGKWWSGIYGDSELASLKTQPHGERFETMYKERNQSQGVQSPP